MTIYLVTSLPKKPYIHLTYIWFWPTLTVNHRTRRRAFPLKKALSLPCRVRFENYCDGRHWLQINALEEELCLRTSLQCTQVHNAMHTSGQCVHNAMHTSAHCNAHKSTMQHTQVHNAMHTSGQVRKQGSWVGWQRCQPTASSTLNTATPTPTCKQTHTQTRARTHTHTHAPTYTHTNKRTLTYTFTRTQTCTHAHVHIHTAHTHTHMPEKQA